MYFFQQFNQNEIFAPGCLHSVNFCCLLSHSKSIFGMDKIRDISIFKTKKEPGQKLMTDRYILNCTGSDGKASICNAGVLGFIPGVGISPGERNGTPAQYSCLENSMDRGTWASLVAQRVKHKNTFISCFGTSGLGVGEGTQRAKSRSEASHICWGISGVGHGA